MTSYITIPESEVSLKSAQALDYAYSCRNKKIKECYEGWKEHKNKKTLWRGIFGYPKHDDSYEGVKSYYYRYRDYSYDFHFAENSYHKAIDRLTELCESTNRTSKELMQLSVEDSVLIAEWNKPVEESL